MNTTTESDAYLGAVRLELDDLPEDERADLLEDLAQHLADVTANRGDDAPALTTLLGPPEQYAAELRAAAELPPRRAVQPAVQTKESFTQRLGRSFPARAGLKIWRRPEAKAVREFLPLLRPAWWVLRGYLVVAIPALWSPDYNDDFPVPSIAGSHLIGLLVVLAAIVVSVKLGRLSLAGWRRKALIAGNLLVVILGLSLFGDAGSRMTPQVTFVQTAGDSKFELMSPHGPVTNIFPYAADGSPLDNVLLFDQDGRPLRVSMQEWWRDGCFRMPVDPKAADGVGVDFAYPKQYEVVKGRPGACMADVTRPPVPLPDLAVKPAAPDAPIAPIDPNTPIAPLAPIAPSVDGSAAPAAEASPGPAADGSAAPAAEASPGPAADGSAAPAGASPAPGAGSAEPAGPGNAQTEAVPAG